MGRTTAPLTIVVHPGIQRLKVLSDLAEKGHNVVLMDDELARADLILGVNAHYYTGAMVDLNILEPAFKRARLGRKAREAD